MPLTPEEPICNEFSPTGQDPLPSQPMQLIVLIDNTNFDASGYEPLFATTLVIGKRSRSDSPEPPDLGSDEKRPRVNLAAFFQAFAASSQSLPGKLLVLAIQPPPPDYHHLREHPYRREFTLAMDIEFNKLLQMNIFEPISASLIQQAYAREYGNIS